MSLERDRAGLQLAPLEGHRERQRLGRRADHAQRHGRHLPADDRQVPEAAQARPQHHRPDAPPRHPDADQGRGDVPRAQRHLLDARVDRRRRRHARRGAQRDATAFEKAGKTIARDAGAAEEAPLQLRHLHRRSSRKNLDDADNILAWAKKEKLDIVFNMVRFTDAMLGNSELERTACKPIGAEEAADAPVLPRPRAAGSAARRPELHLHALRRHDRQRLSPHWRPARSRRRASC